MRQRGSMSSELLKLFLSAFCFLDLEYVEPHRLAEWPTLAHHHYITEFNIPGTRRGTGYG